MPQRLRPRPEGRCSAAFSASAPRNLCAGALRIAGDFLGEPRFADSRLTGKAKELTASARDAGKARAQLAQLALAPDESPAYLPGTFRG